MARTFKVGIAAAAAVLGLGAPTATASTLPTSADLRATIDHVIQDAYGQLPPEVTGAVPRVDDCSNCVALTYDDGPGAETNRLLDTLRDRDAHASFMTVGTNAAANAGPLKRMQAEGHTIGNHTENHPQLSALDDATIGAEIDQASDTIEHATGQRPQWLRPPYGDTADNVSRVAGERGMSLALWSIDTRDWATRDAGATCQATVDQAQPGAIVLMHDIHASSVDAVNCILDGLESKGLRAASLDEMIPDSRPGVTYTQRG